MVAKQNAPGNAAQSASTLHPGAQTSPAPVISTHALGRFRAFPPPAPRPAQSVARAHGFVHPSPPQESPGLHPRAA